jgi:hypothetical protein
MSYIDNIPKLREHRNFLLEYPWREKFPQEVDGILNVLDYLIGDNEEES